MYTADIEFKPFEITETPELAKRIDPVAARLAREYWVDPEYGTLEAQGVDVGRMIFYSLAVDTERRRILSDPKVMEAVADYRAMSKKEQEAVDLKPFDEIPVNVLEAILPVDGSQQKLIALSKAKLTHAMGLGAVHDLNLGQALSVAAENYLDQSSDDRPLA